MGMISRIFRLRLYSNRPRNIKGGGGGIALPQLQNDFKGGFPVLTRSSSQLAARSFVRGLEIRLYAPARGSEI
jgi:hypothetical protein